MAARSESCLRPISGNGRPQPLPQTKPAVRQTQTASSLFKKPLVPSIRQPQIKEATRQRIMESYKEKTPEKTVEPPARTTTPKSKQASGPVSDVDPVNVASGPVRQPWHDPVHPLLSTPARRFTSEYILNLINHVPTPSPPPAHSSDEDEPTYDLPRPRARSSSPLRPSPRTKANDSPPIPMEAVREHLRATLDMVGVKSDEEWMKNDSGTIRRRRLAAEAAAASANAGAGAGNDATATLRKAATYSGIERKRKRYLTKKDKKDQDKEEQDEAARRYQEFETHLTELKARRKTPSPALSGRADRSDRLQTVHEAEVEEEHPDSSPSAYRQDAQFKPHTIQATAPIQLQPSNTTHHPPSPSRLHTSPKKSSPLRAFKSTPVVGADEAGIFDDEDFDFDPPAQPAVQPPRPNQRQPPPIYAAQPRASSHQQPLGPSLAFNSAGNPRLLVDAQLDFDDDDFADALGDPNPAPQVGGSAQVSLNSEAKVGSIHREEKVIKRYLIRRVISEQHAGRTQKNVLLRTKKDEPPRVVLLRDSWSDSECAEGAFVHVIGDFDQNGQCVVDDKQNMIILHPDHLISSTVVADSFTCNRRAVLQDRVKATSESSPPIVYGTLIHQIFQEAMMQRKWDLKWLAQKADEMLQKSLEDLHKARLDLETATAHLRTKMPAVQEWARTFIADRPRPHASVKDIAGSAKPRKLAIRRLLEVEEHVWSPMYGLKGNIDATVEAMYEDVNGQVSTVLTPLELKTGKNKSPNHHAQTALYTLLLSDRYDVEVAAGILYYTETSETLRIPAVRHELRHMVQQRNTMAAYLKDRLALPPMKKDEFQCKKCYAKTACFVYHKAIEGGDGESSGLPKAFDTLTGHLTRKDQDFFRKWDDLLMKEERDMMKFRRELWTMASTERESLGRCFGGVAIDHNASYEAENSEKINRYQYTFFKSDCKRDFSFVESQISMGEPIVISDEEGHYALANGYVVHIYKHRLVVAVDRKLRDSRKQTRGFHPTTNQVFTGLDLAPSSQAQRTSDGKPTLYRIDRDEFSNGMATARNNLVQLMDDQVHGSSKVRKLIVDGAPPRFRDLDQDAADTVLSQNGLNDDQKNAIHRVLSAKDYALVLGMPGTGKTTTIAQIIKALTSLGKSVVLTSYTHSAVDNILLKLRDDMIPIMRLGALAKIHPEVKEFALLDALPKSSLEEIRDSYQKPKVVATTCLGVNHAIFLERIFDYCIVDEASQITMPVCIGPIRMARSFVLVGDHYQLTPLVKDDEAKAGGLDESLFKYLSDTRPESVVNLEHQYRMNSEITRLSSTLIYSGRLKPGTVEVAERRLELPNATGLEAMHPPHPHQPTGCRKPDDDCWLSRVIDPAAPVCFVATDRISAAREQVTNSRVDNPLECTLVGQTVEALIMSGVSASSIGVISFYRSQISLLRYSLGHRPGVELHTVDKFQGRDKEVVIVSWVRSNEKGEIGELLQDWRRINVAITRARSKLILVGDTGTLGQDQLLKKMIGMIREEGRIIDLKEGEQQTHTSQALQGTQFHSGPSPERRSHLKKKIVSPFYNRDGSPKKVILSPRPKRKFDGVQSPGSSPLKERSSNVADYEGPKQARVSRKVLLKDRPILRDIMNDVGV